MPLDPGQRAEIHELYARYAHSFDAGDGEGYAAVFTDDGVFSLGAERDVRGAVELAAFVGERGDATPGITHHTTNILLDETADGVRGAAYVIVLRTSPGEPLRFRNMGRYDDDIVRQPDGTWRFRRRVFTSWLAPEDLDRPIAFG